MKVRMTNEAKTGMVVLIAAVLLGLLVLKVGNFTVFQKGYTIKSHFRFTAGVKKHAPVRLSGVDVGEVKDIRVIYGDDTTVEAVLWLEDGVKVRQDSKAYVTTLGLMGEKYIEIQAGTSKTPYAQSGDVIPSEDPVRLEDLIKIGTKVAEDISKMAGDISHLAKRIDETVADNKPRIDAMFENFEETSENFRDFSEDVKYHPWKVLFRGKEVPVEQRSKDREKRRIEREKKKEAAKTQAAATALEAAPAPETTLPSAKSNFGHR